MTSFVPSKTPVVCICLYLLLTTSVLLATLHKTQGHFTYSLDDPYIQLSLSEDLAYGHYGLNAGEPSSPSSSPLWPFLLLPFAGTSTHAFVPLIWNMLFGVAASWLIGCSIERWPNRPNPSSRPFVLKQMAAGLLMVPTANLVGITFIGMEHMLEILLALAVAYGFNEALDGRSVPAWCLAAAAVGPLVRYESLAITVATALLLIGLHRKKAAAVVLAAALIPLAAFSVFLHGLGLPLLPSSVLVKSGAFERPAAPTSPLAMPFGELRTTASDLLSTGNRWAMLALVLLLVFAAWRTADSARRRIFAAAAMVPALQLIFGPFGGFHRYEIYATAFAALVLMCAAAHRLIPSAAVYAVLIILAARSLQFTLNTPRAADGIYGQQYQMHRFITEFFPTRFAVNDIGLVSYQKPSSSYVLDLSGLNSLEAARAQNRDAEWLGDIARRHDMALAMIPAFGDVPSNWTLLGELRLMQPPITAAHRCVAFYSTNPATVKPLTDALQRFIPTLPPETQFLPPQQSSSDRELADCRD
jgi:hypothetical protein